MMKHTIGSMRAYGRLFAVLAGGLGIGPAVAAPVYLCPSADGKPEYSSQRLNQRCEESSLFVEGPNNDRDGIEKLWYQSEFQIDPDVTVVSPTEAAKKVPLNIHLRNQPKPKAAPVRTAVVSAPVPVVKTRRQLLQSELAGEQRALRQTQQRLAQARASAADVTRIRQLERAVADRQENIRAIQSEMPPI